MKSGAKWLVRDKSRLLLEIMEELAGNAHISFEGDLQGFKLNKFADVSGEETAVLRRNMIWPRQDLLVLPLGALMGQRILAAIGGAVPRRINYIQIKKDGIVQFAAYDNFHPECLF